MAREDKGRKDDEEHEEVRPQRAQRDVHGLPHFGERRVVLHQTKRRQKGQDQTQGVHVGDVVVPVECTKRWEERERRNHGLGLSVRAPCSVVPLRCYLQRHDVAVLHVMRQGGVDQHDVGTFIHDDHDKHGQLAKHLQKE